LKRQGRFRHLFEPERDDEVIAHIQATVNEYWIAALKSKLSTEVEASLHNDPA
jgi:predicted transcriptional regulator